MGAYDEIIENELEKTLDERVSDLEKKYDSIEFKTISPDQRSLDFILKSRNSLDPGHQHMTHFVYAAPDKDKSYSGMIIKLTANEAQAIGDVCYINSDGEAQLGDADAFTTSQISVMAVETIAADIVGTYLLSGIVRNDSWNWSPVGGYIYLSTSGTTGNTLTQTPPSAPDDAIVILGVATHADRLMFNPARSKDVIDVQIFTSDGNWTKPVTTDRAQCNRVFVELWGAGGGGGAGQSAGPTPGGGGGGGGGYICGWFDPDTLDATEAVVVGTGGAGASTTTEANGTAGESSTFDKLTAYGGGGGEGDNGGNGTTGGGGAGSLAVGETPGNSGSPGSPIGGNGTTIAGGNGFLSGGGAGSSAGDSNGGSCTYGGAGGGAADGGTGTSTGGTSIYGGGGGAGRGGADGSAGSVPGGGGGGSSRTSGTATAGAGARGEVRVISFF